MHPIAKVLHGSHSIILQASKAGGIDLEFFRTLITFQYVSICVLTAAHLIPARKPCIRQPFFQRGFVCLPHQQDLWPIDG